MNLRVRLGLLILLFSVQLLYFPINRIVTGGVVLDTRLDAWIPLWPVWVFPYLLSLLWWSGCFTWAAIKMEAPLYRALVVGVLFTALTSYAVYVLYPTYVIRPEVHGNDFAADVVRYLYANDRVNNAFPSGHTYNSVLIVLFWWSWQPRLRWLCVTIACIVVLSTLFTGQHNVLDLVGGVAWAWAGYRFGLWWGQRRGCA